MDDRVAEEGWLPPSSMTSLADLLRYRAASQPDDRAYVVLSGRGSEGGRGDLVARLAAWDIEWVAIEEDTSAALVPTMRHAPAGDDAALLQYTSGSTSAPKGVIVSHANLLANLAMIKAAFGNTRRSTYVSWVPLYHDMGLVINVLQSLYVGSLCVLMAPVAFIQRPLTWLRAISDYRAEVAVAPNFGFDLSVARYRPEPMEGLDLSLRKFASNGAE